MHPQQTMDTHRIARIKYKLVAVCENGRVVMLLEVVREH